MKFKFFKSGKSKEKKKPSNSNAASTQIAELEEQLNDWTDNLKQTEQRLKKLADKASKITEQEAAPIQEPGTAPIHELEVTPIQPHGPIRELVVEAEGDVGDDTPGEELEVVKMVEVQPKAEPPSPAAKDEKSALAGDSFKELFVNDEDEENPLVNLIHSLPEVTTDELEEDLKEIKEIIKDWQKK